MSYELIGETEPKARKEHDCIWCPEKILKGEKHVHEVSKYDGELQDFRWHPECNKAAIKFFFETGEEFEPHMCKRGTTEKDECTMTTGELELEFQLMRRNNPSMNEEQLREAMFKRAMEATCDDLAEERFYDEGVPAVSLRDIYAYKGKIR